MDPELLDMLAEHIQSYRNEEKIRYLRDSFERLVEDPDASFFSYLMGCLYGSCLFLVESYTSKTFTEKEEKQLNEIINTQIKGVISQITY